MTPSLPLDLTPLFQAIEDACQRAELSPLYLLVGTLEVARARCMRVIWAKEAGPVSPVKTVTQEPDEALTAGQCARLSGWQRGRSTGERTGFSPRWFYDHADELPFRIGGRGRHPVRFSRRGYLAWLEAR